MEEKKGNGGDLSRRQTEEISAAEYLSVFGRVTEGAFCQPGPKARGALQLAEDLVYGIQVYSSQQERAAMIQRDLSLAAQGRFVRVPIGSLHLFRKGYDS